MPIYEYSCMACENAQEEFKLLKDRLNGPICNKCGHKMIFTLSFSARQGPAYPYTDTNMDHKPVEITSLSQRKKELKKRGLQDSGVRRGNPGSWI